MKKTVWQLALSLGLLLTSVSVLAAEADKPSQRRHHTKQRMHTHRPAKGPLMGMLQDLNLSAEQQIQLKALYSNRQQKAAGMKTMQEQLKTAFISDRFDAAALKQQLQRQPQDDSAQEMAEKTLKAWQILTPEQRVQVEARLQKMAEKMAQKIQRSTARAEKNANEARSRKLPRHLAALNLTEAQQEQLKASWSAKNPVQGQSREALKNTAIQILAALKSGQATPESLAPLMPATQMQQGAEQMIDRMAALHQVLTPAQRQQMVTLMQQRHTSWQQRRQGT